MDQVAGQALAAYRKLLEREGRAAVLAADLDPARRAAG
jgi:hypothetical protein